MQTDLRLKTIAGLPVVATEPPVDWQPSLHLLLQGDLEVASCLEVAEVLLEVTLLCRSTGRWRWWLPRARACWRPAQGSPARNAPMQISWGWSGLSHRYVVKNNKYKKKSKFTETINTRWWQAQTFGWFWKSDEKLDLDVRTTWNRWFFQKTLNRSFSLKKRFSMRNVHLVPGTMTLIIHGPSNARFTLVWCTIYNSM